MKSRERLAEALVSQALSVVLKSNTYTVTRIIAGVFQCKKFAFFHITCNF